LTVYLTPSLPADVDPGPSDGLAAVEPELAVAAPNARTADAATRANQTNRLKRILPPLLETG
jgi:hypothetical protein